MTDLAIHKAISLQLEKYKWHLQVYPHLTIKYTRWEIPLESIQTTSEINLWLQNLNTNQNLGWINTYSLWNYKMNYLSCRSDLFA